MQAEECRHTLCTLAGEHLHIDTRIIQFHAQRRFPHRQARRHLAGHACTLAKEHEHRRINIRQSAQHLQIVAQRVHHAVGQTAGFRARAHDRHGAVLKEHRLQRHAGKSARTGRNGVQPGVVDLAVCIRQLALRHAVARTVAHQTVQRRHRRLLHHVAKHGHAFDVHHQFAKLVNIHLCSSFSYALSLFHPA